MHQPFPKISKNNMEDSTNTFKETLKIAAVIGTVVLGSAFLGSRRDTARAENNISFKQDVEKMYLKAAGADSIIDAKEKADLLQKLGLGAKQADLEGRLVVKEGLHQANVYVINPETNDIQYVGAVSQSQVQDYNNRK